MEGILKISVLMNVFIALQFSPGQNTSHSYSSQMDTVRQDLILKKSFEIKHTYFPSGLIITGLVLNGGGPESIKKEIVEERNEHLPNFSTHIDDFLQYSPLPIVYGLDAFGARSKNDLINRTAILLKGELGMIAITQVLKSTTRIQRPDLSNNYSFPSGHTAQAFLAATFLSEEYKHKFEWIPYFSYSIASTVGVMRMANNKHYISDVLVGAGIGIISMKISYWTHRYKWSKKRK